MTTNSQQSTTESKKSKTKIKQTARTGTELQKQKSHGGLSARSGENGREGTGNNKHKWQAQNRQGQVKNSIGNGEAKEVFMYDLWI